MVRRWALLGILAVLGAVGAVVLLSNGMDSSSPHEPDPEVQAVMGKLQASQGVIQKELRSTDDPRVRQSKLVAAARVMAESIRTAREFTGPARFTGRPQSEWAADVDGFLRATDEFAQTAGRDGVQDDNLKAANLKLQQSCSTCHQAFRKG